MARPYQPAEVAFDADAWHAAAGFAGASERVPIRWLADRCGFRMASSDLGDMYVSLVARDTRSRSSRAIPLPARVRGHARAQWTTGGGLPWIRARVETESSCSRPPEGCVQDDLRAGGYAGWEAMPRRSPGRDRTFGQDTRRQIGMRPAATWQLHGPFGSDPLRARASGQIRVKPVTASTSPSAHTFVGAAEEEST